MYIAALIKNRAGEKITVKATAKCGILYPQDMTEKITYALMTNKLLANFMIKLRPYANENHAIEEIKTDNLWLLNKFTDEGLRAEFLPDLESEAE